MVLYLSVVGVAVVIISILNILLNPMLVGFNTLWVVVAVLLGVVIEVCIDGFFAWFIHSLPNKFFSKDKKFYKVSKKERKFYDKLHIKNWKDKVWELGALGGFRKNKLADPNSPEYLELFIIECNKGFLGHFLGIIFGFLILLFPLPKYFLCIGLPIALVNLFLNSLSSMVLRYNVPKLTIALERAKKMQNLKDKKDVVD